MVYDTESTPQFPMWRYMTVAEIDAKAKGNVALTTKSAEVKKTLDATSKAYDAKLVAYKKLSQVVSKPLLNLMPQSINFLHYQHIQVPTHQHQQWLLKPLREIKWSKYRMLILNILPLLSRTIKLQ